MARAANSGPSPSTSASRYSRRVSDERGPVGRLPHRVQLQRDLPEPEVAVEAVRQRDDLDVHVGVIDAEHLGADLPVLTEPAPLGSLVPEVGRQVPDFPGGRRPVLHVGAHDRRGPLGPQGQVPAAPVGELVHLLADHIGANADPLEHLDVLHHRGDHQPVPEAGGTVGERRDEAHPAVRVGGQHVVGPHRRAVVGIRRRVMLREGASSARC